MIFHQLFKAWYCWNHGNVSSLNLFLKEAQGPRPQNNFTKRNKIKNWNYISCTRVMLRIIMHLARYLVGSWSCLKYALLISVFDSPSDNLFPHWYIQTHRLRILVLYRMALSSLLIFWQRKEELLLDLQNTLINSYNPCHDPLYNLRHPIYGYSSARFSWMQRGIVVAFEYIIQCTLNFR